MKKINNDNITYANCIQELKVRLFKIKNILNNNSIEQESQIEFACLQMRKICEIFAFSTLTANRIEYEKVRSKFEEDWNYKEIVKLVKKVNDKYYPEPLQSKQLVNEKNNKYNGVHNDFLLIDDITEIYIECCGLIHAKNPYTTGGVTLTKDNFLEWSGKFIKLLNCHVVGYNTIEFRKIFITHMYAEDINKKVMVIEATSAKEKHLI